MIVVTEHGIQEDFAQALCVYDNDLEKIKENVLLVHDFMFIMGLLDKRGENLVFIRLELKGRHNVLKQVSELLLKYKSVSWVRNDRLFTRRSK